MSESETTAIVEVSNPKGKQFDFIIGWWKVINDESHKGERAELRRCETPKAVQFTKQFNRVLWKALQEKSADEQRTSFVHPDSLAIVVGILAHVETSAHISLGAQMAAKKNKDSNIVSDLRFRRLLQTKNDDDFYRLLRRVLLLLDRTANIADLINFCYFRNDTAKRQLAKEYYKP